MREFSKSSAEKLATCHPDLQRLFNAVLQVIDCSILCGERDKEAQDEAVRTGHSELAFPLSKHNRKPSEAVDAAPYPIDWKDNARFYFFAGVVFTIAQQLGIKIRLGCDFNGDFNFSNDTFKDCPHFELVMDE